MRGLLINLGQKARRWAFMLAAASVLAVQVASTCASPKAPKQVTFDSPDEVVTAFADALRKGERPTLLKILGPRGEEILSSGDPVADDQLKGKFLAAYDEKHQVVKKTQTNAELVVGKSAWPFPIPIVKVGRKWLFDTGRGVEEVLNRRIGRNELSTIDVLEAFVHAEKEYHQLDYDQDAVLEYAQKIVSSEGKRDGLYWPVSKGEKQSPMGALFARAASEGYIKQGEKPAPYHGYFYKLLLAQGPEAAGGAFPYVVNGNMVSGYAMVAWPAEYGNSGIMTFQVNSNGTIYEKDLGEKTGEAAAGMAAYNPDTTWKRAK